MKNTLTTGNLWQVMLRFSVPFLIASLLQTFYGLADLFITGIFNGADEVTAVSIGSQLMHMFIVLTIGLATGTTVAISRAIGGNDRKAAVLAIGNSAIIFSIIAILATFFCLANITSFLELLNTPPEARDAAGAYLFYCFLGIPFIVAYNVLSSIFRGLGNTRSPMIFVAIAGIFNVGLDYLLIGPFQMGAAGAAIATVVAQIFSTLLAVFSLAKLNTILHLTKAAFHYHWDTCKTLLGIGIPIACQEGLIQVSFLVITMIANSRGLAVAAAVGIVEKIISFLFLVPSAMLSTVSAVTAQNAGAGLHQRGRQTLYYGIACCAGFGLIVSAICQIFAGPMVGIFVHNAAEVINLGDQYLRAYSIDCILAGVHFCFSGYFSAYEKSMYSFIHNIISIALIRIPGTYLASIYFLDSLYPMGLAAPAGSLLSIIICIWMYKRFQKQLQTTL